LVIAGALDVGAPPEMAKAIAAAIPGAILKVFDDASHLSVVEQPSAFADTVKAFISA
jgi:3-oxoadipate enol-lactonase